MSVQRSICTTCGYKGGQREAVGGSFIAEIVLWFCFLIPGLIYSLWRLGSKHMVCPQCGNATTIPWVSPRGTELVAGSGGWTEASETSFRVFAMSEWRSRFPSIVLVSSFTFLFFVADCHVLGWTLTAVDVLLVALAARKYPRQ